MSSTSASFRANASAPGLARSVVSDFLSEVISPQFVADAQLLTDELVSNSIRHAGQVDLAEVGLELDLSDLRLRVAVSDPGPVFEMPPRAAKDEDGWTIVVEGPGGWNLVVVDRVSDRWGIISDRPSVVWFELDR